MDWQTVAVALIVAAAAFFVGRRIAQRLRAFTASGAAAGCETGCGKCEAATPKAALGPSLVRISRAPSRPLGGARARSNDRASAGAENA